MPDGGGWSEPSEPPRDLKKLVLIIGLGALSWVATYVGMLELIEANMGELPLVHKLIIAFSVAMLMTMIIWLLDQMFQPIGAFTRLCYVAGYLFLSAISVGFGFGFYWKVLESRSESSRSAETAVTGVQDSLHAASTRLEQLNATLIQLAALSHEKAELERTKGTSCPNSKPGDGPRRKMREEDAARFTFASEFVGGRVASVKADMAALNGDLARIAQADASTFDPKTGTRNEFMKGLNRKLDMTVTGFNALRTDPQLRELRSELSDRANKTTFGDPKSGGFLCPDAQLSQALHGAVRAIDQLPVVEKPTIAAVEGSEATIEAFRRLTATVSGLLTFKLPPSADELRELQKKAVQSVESGAPLPSLEGGGLSSRDYVPLTIAIFVDICLFLVAMGGRSRRLHALVPKMRDAERGPMAQILARFNDIHRDPAMRESFELFRHVVFDRAGLYYVAVPLDAPPRLNPREREALRVEAQLLGNLFTSFEKEQIFKRVWYPLAKQIRKTLRKQGSKFAESEAFRLYRFRDGAWSEIILSTVMGAARRVEAENARRRIERDLFGAPRPELDLSAHEIDTLRAAPRTERSAPREPERPAPEPRDREPDRKRSAPERATAPAAIRPVRRPEPEPEDIDEASLARFGAYAKGARAELMEVVDDEPELPVDAANSNTAPPAPRAKASRAAPDRAGLPDREAEPVTAEPVTAEPVTAEAVTVRPASVVPAAEPPAALQPAEPTVDVILKRETATLSVPLNEAAESLVGRLGEALQQMEAAAGRERLDAGSSTADSPAIARAEPPILLVAAPDSDPAEVDLATDVETADAAHIAGRLRPALSSS